MKTILGAVLILSLAGCASRPATEHVHPAAPLAAEAPPPQYTDLGDWHHAISCQGDGAQAYFDQGLRLIYAFNHDEAVRAFAEAARRDPTCAMAYWGAALALGPNINLPLDPQLAATAYAALREAQRLAPRASAEEQAYIAALATRYGADPDTDRIVGDNQPAGALLRLASLSLAGEIAARRRECETAIGTLEESVSVQDGLPYMEPPPWYMPQRQALGAVLLGCGRADAAEQVFREDLRRNPDNGWSLFGLAQGLRAEGDSRGAAQAEAQFRAAWQRADVSPPS